MSDSLFARARRRPERSAEIVTGNPAKPTTAFSTGFMLFPIILPLPIGNSYVAYAERMFFES